MKKQNRKQVLQEWRYLEPDDTLLPGAYTRKVDLSEGLVGQLQINTLWGDCELEGHGLVGFCHDYYAR